MLEAGRIAAVVLLVAVGNAVAVQAEAQIAAVADFAVHSLRFAIEAEQAVLDSDIAVDWVVDNPDSADLHHVAGCHNFAVRESLPVARTMADSGFRTHIDSVLGRADSDLAV